MAPFASCWKGAKNFDSVTRYSLIYTLKRFGLRHDDDLFERNMENYVSLDVYPDTIATLHALRVSGWRSYRMDRQRTHGAHDLRAKVLRSAGTAFWRFLKKIVRSR